MGEAVGVDTVGNGAVKDDGAKDGKAVGVDAVGDDGARVGEVVEVDAVGNLAVGDDGGRDGKAVEVDEVTNISGATTLPISVTCRKTSREETGRRRQPRQT